MKTIVVTGSTRGIGFGLVDDFLKLGTNVVVSGRTPASVKTAVERLIKAHGESRILGVPCDVSRPEEVQALWDAAVKRFSSVDVWINNAGLSSPRLPFWLQSPIRARAVVETNLIGVMNGCQVALNGMLAQGQGHIWNMEGFGSGGQKAEGIAIYGATKRAVTYFTEALLKDTKGKNVGVSFLSPGIVVTDLLKDDYKDAPEAWEKAKKFFNILGDKVETVTPFLAKGVLETEKTGSRVAWLTTGKAFFRFMTAFRKRDIFT